MPQQVSAAASYAARRRAIRSKLNAMQKILEDHCKEFEADGSRNYGYVGDVTLVDEKLDQLLSFFKGE